MKQSSDKSRFKNICNVSRETFNLLSKYEEILKKKNNEFNLIGKSTLPIIWTRHFADSLKLEATLELLISNYKKKIKRHSIAVEVVKILGSDYQLISLYLNDFNPLPKRGFSLNICNAVK